MSLILYLAVLLVDDQLTLFVAGDFFSPLDSVIFKVKGLVGTFSSYRLDLPDLVFIEDFDIIIQQVRISRWWMLIFFRRGRFIFKFFLLFFGGIVVPFLRLALGDRDGPVIFITFLF